MQQLKTQTNIVTICADAACRPTLQAFVAFDDDGASDVAVFHGANGAFCAGWDLVKGKEMLESDGDMTHFDFDSDQQKNGRIPAPMGPSRLLLSKPVIAAIR
jgi:enoyl-CoA hydratase